MDSKYRHYHKKYNYRKRRKVSKKMNRKSGFFRVMLDIILICITGGFWGLYLIVKFLRGNTR